MKVSLSHVLSSSFPHIGQNGTFKTPINNFGHLMPSSFHNCMVGPSLGLHKTLIRYTLCYITNHRTLSTKKLKHTHLHMTDKDIWAIIPISIDPKFEIRDFLNELQNEWTILGNHECFHQIRHAIIIPFFQFVQQISKTSVNIFMCAQL